MHPLRSRFGYTNLKRVFNLFVILFFSTQLHLYSQQLPIGYISYYSQKGNHPDFLKTLVIKPSSSIVINKEKTFAVLNPILNDSTNILLPPTCRGIIVDKIFGEYIIEFEYKIQAGSLSGTSGLYFLSPVKSDDTYYATVFSNDTISFLHIDEGTIIKSESVSSVKLNTGWNKVKIQRDILSRKLEITMNGDVNSRISFTDKNLVMGFVGFGSQDISGYLRNVNIWAPTAFSDTLYYGE